MLYPFPLVYGNIPINGLARSSLSVRSSFARAASRSSSDHAIIGFAAGTGPWLTCGQETFGKSKLEVHAWSVFALAPHLVDQQVSEWQAFRQNRICGTGAEHQEASDSVNLTLCHSERSVESILSVPLNGHFHRRETWCEKAHQHMDLLAGSGKRCDRFGDASIQFVWGLASGKYSARSNHLVYELLQGGASISFDQHCHGPRPLVSCSPQSKLTWCA